MTDELLKIDELTVQYDTPNGPLTAVSDASLTIGESEFYGLAGESGSGKSTLVKSLIGALDNNGHIESGKIEYRGREIQDYSGEDLNEDLRWKEIAWIPQASMNTLDPLMKVKDQALGIADTHTNLSDEEALRRFKRIFEVVGIQESRVDDYPHQFSGGMQQRAIIALALFLEPSLIIADEPTTALDVIMQDQILKYLDKIKQDQNIAMILVTHDISVILETCDKISIMHASQVAEKGTTEEVYENPKHPYTYMFKNAFPDVRHPDRDLDIIEGYPPQFIGEVDSCSFADRCPVSVDECHKKVPQLEPIRNGDSHQVSCFRKDEMGDQLMERDKRADGGK